MNLRRFLFTLFAALMATASFGPASFAQSTAKMFTLKAANQCASVSVAGYPTVGIQVTGTFSATLQPEVSIAGQSPQNTQVTPTTSATAQSTITTTGTYAAAVGGMDTFLLCVSSYVSGSAVVWLNPSAAVNASLLSGGGGSAPLTFSIPAAVTSLVAYGDSITAGFASPQPQQNWAQFFANSAGLQNSFTNVAVAGHHLNQTGFIVSAYGTSGSAAVGSIGLYGTNELTTFNGSASNATSVISGEQAMAVWLALPSSQIELASAMTPSGTWVTSSDLGLTAQFSIGNNIGSTLTGSVTGSVVYVTGSVFYTYNSIFDVLVDGVSTSGGTGYTLTGVAVLDDFPFCLRFPGYSAGLHTVVVKIMSGNTSTVISWIGGNGTSPQTPWVAMGGALPYVTTPTAVGPFNAALSAMTTTLAGDGLNVVYVNDGAGMALQATAGSPVEFVDGVHPNNFGQYLVEQNWVNSLSKGSITQQTLVALLSAMTWGDFTFAPQTVTLSQVVLTGQVAGTATAGAAILPIAPTGFLNVLRGTVTVEIPYYSQ